MKSEIVGHYPLPEGFFIKQVLAINSDYTALLIVSYPDIKLTVIANDGFKEIYFDLLSFTNNFSVSLFKYKNGFGLIHSLNQLWLWPTVNAPVEKVKMEDPFLPEPAILPRFFDAMQAFFNSSAKPMQTYFPDNHQANQVFFDEATLLFYISVANPKTLGGPGRYWAVLDSSKAKPFWHELNELPAAQYPTTEFAKYGFDWLSIAALAKLGDNVYVHTIGGTTTRLKSGKNYEFSIISQLSADNDVIYNYHIEEGKGRFSADGRYFILKKRSVKKLLFYHTSNFQIDFELSLTPKQNLGTDRGNMVLCDLVGDVLYMHNGGFFNVCRLLR